jgi:Bacteriophage baseplate protein W
MSITGMDVYTGKPISGNDHLRQSIRDILTTPVGSRVMRRSYGSGIFKLLHQPIDALLKAKLQVSIADALRKYETRVRFTRVQVNEIDDQLMELDIEGYYVENNKAFKLTQFKI